MNKKILLVSLAALLLTGCGGTTSGGKTSGGETPGGGGDTPTPAPGESSRDIFLRAKTKTFENDVYEYNYTAEAKIKFKDAVSFTPANLSGTIQYNKNAANTQYMHRKDVTGPLVFDYTTYTYNQGLNMITINADESKDFSIINKDVLPNNYQFETNSIGLILKTLADNDNLKVTKSGDQYNLDLKTSFAQSSFLSVLNYVDSKKIIDTLSDLTVSKWGVGFGYNCYAKLNAAETSVSAFHFDAHVNVKDTVEIGFTFDQTFSKVGSGVTIQLPEFQNTEITPEGIQSGLNAIGNALYKSRPNYYKYNVHTKVDHGVSKGNPFGMGVDSTSKGFAERQIIGNKVYFHNELEVDSDYKNKDQYPDDIEDYKLTRAKVNDGNDTVYDVENPLIGKKTYTELKNYNNDAIDDYYMLPNETVLSTSSIPVLRKTVKDTKTTYKVGLTSDAIKDILKYYNKFIRLDKEGVKWIDVYDIKDGFNARKCDLEFVIENGMLLSIDGHMKGQYNIEANKEVKFEFDLEIEFVNNKKQYTAPTNYKDIDC